MQMESASLLDVLLAFWPVVLCLLLYIPFARRRESPRPLSLAQAEDALDSDARPPRNARQRLVLPVLALCIVIPRLDPPLEAMARVAVDSHSTSRPWEQPKAVARFVERRQAANGDEAAAETDADAEEWHNAAAVAAAACDEATKPGDAMVTAAAGGSCTAETTRRLRAVMQRLRQQRARRPLLLRLVWDQVFYVELGAVSLPCTFAAPIGRIRGARAGSQDTSGGGSPEGGADTGIGGRGEDEDDVEAGGAAGEPWTRQFADEFADIWQEGFPELRGIRGKLRRVLEPKMRGMGERRLINTAAAVLLILCAYILQSGTGTGAGVQTDDTAKATRQTATFGDDGIGGINGTNHGEEEVGEEEWRSAKEEEEEEEEDAEDEEERGRASAQLSSTRTLEYALKLHGVCGFGAVQSAGALLVLTSHAYQFLGHATFAHEPLRALTGGALTLGVLGSSTLFTVSGFLAARSLSQAQQQQRWQQDAGTGLDGGATVAWQFVRRRALRLLPEYWLQVAFTVAVLGPCVTTLPLPSPNAPAAVSPAGPRVVTQAAGASSPLAPMLWFINLAQTRQYAWEASVPFLSPLHTTQQMMRLPGVFDRLPMQRPNPILWSLPYQIEAWLLLALLHAACYSRGGHGRARRGQAARRLSRAGAKVMAHAVLCITLAFAALAQIAGEQTDSSGNNLTGGSELWLLAHFFAGAACFGFRKQLSLDSRFLHTLNPLPVLMVAAVMGVAHRGGTSGEGSSTALPHLQRAFVLPMHVYCVVYIACSKPQLPERQIWWRFACNMGRDTYGVFLYGSIVQQVLVHAYRDSGLTPTVCFWAALPLAVTAARLSRAATSTALRILGMQYTY